MGYREMMQMRQFISEHGENMTDEELCEKFNRYFGKNRSVEAIKKMRQRMGIMKARGRRQPEDNC